MGIDYRKEQGIVTLTIEVGTSVNTLGAAFMAAFQDVVTRLEAEENLVGVILTSARKDFIAGADLDELYAMTDAAKAFEYNIAFKEVARRFETLGKPTVAALNGTALGGGFEVALTCHRRIALNHPAIRFGFPEVTLGLFPGGGGCQRLPRMIGIQATSEIIMEGSRFDPATALAKGLVDELAATPEAMMAAAKAWIEANPESQQPWDRKDFRMPGGHPNSPKVAQVLTIAPSMLNQKTRGNYPAQKYALSAIYEGALVPFDSAGRIEARYFAATVTSQVAKNMMTAFWYQLNQIKKGGSRGDHPPTKVEKVGILGAGMMGSGIAYSSARSGLQVVLKDVSLDAARRGKGYSESLMAKRIARGKATEQDAAQLLERITPTDQVNDLADCDLIIEAVFEDRELKARVTKETESLIADTAIFASNTSTLPISGLAEHASRPANFIGLHFFSPVDKMPLVEIILGKETAPATLARAFDYVLQIGKTPIVVNDSRGFYTSRVFGTYVNEGIAMLAEGVAPRSIESAGLQAGMPVGPLAVADEVSLSLIHHIRSQTRRDMGDAYEPHPSDEVMTRMVTQLERPGKKAGAGFYEYPKDGKKYLWPGLAEQYPQADSQPDQQWLIDRLLYRQAIETVRCLEEGVLTSAADANLGSIFGWGFAPFHGGTLQFIDAVGLTEFIARAEALAAQLGKRFAVPQKLRDMAAAGETFQ